MEFLEIVNADTTLLKLTPCEVRTACMLHINPLHMLPPLPPHSVAVLVPAVAPYNNHVFQVL